MTQFDSTTNPLPGLREELAEARKALRDAEDTYTYERWRAEGLLLAQHDGDAKKVGANESDRERAYGLFAEMDVDCKAARVALRVAQYEVDRLTAIIDGLRDQRRDEESRLRERALNVAEEQPRGAFYMPHLQGLAS